MDTIVKNDTLDLLPLNHPSLSEKWDDRSYHKTLTCINHQDMRWSTKNPFDRSIFFNGPYAKYPQGECSCSFKDLMYIA